jgi:hypothetical protein
MEFAYGVIGPPQWQRYIVIPLGMAIIMLISYFNQHANINPISTISDFHIDYRLTHGLFLTENRHGNAASSPA